MTYRAAEKAPGLNLLIAFMVIEFGRPQTFIPPLREAPLGWAFQLSLLIFLIITNKFDISLIQTKLFLVLVGLMMLHVPMAENNFWAYTQWRGTALQCITYLSLIAIVDSQEKLQRFIFAWIVVNIIAGVVGILNKGCVPGSPIMGDENDFALAMNMAIPCATFLLIAATTPMQRVICVVSVFISIAANVSSLSRGGFIGLVAVGIYILAFSRKYLKYAVVMVALGAAFLMFYSSSKYWDEMDTILTDDTEEGADTTGAIRKYYWHVARQMFMDNPFIGVGQGNFPWNIAKYEVGEGYLGRSHASRECHSLYYTLLAELGLAGIFLYGGILYSNIKGIWPILFPRAQPPPDTVTPEDSAPNIRDARFKMLQATALGVTGMLVGYLVTGMFLSVLYYPYFFLVASLHAAIIKIYDKEYLHPAPTGKVAP